MSRQSGLIRYIRNFLSGRDLNLDTHHREIKSQSSRSIPAPYLPSGPAHKLADNYYYTRDLRREVGPPVIISTSAMLLESESSETKALDRSQAPPVPGTGHDWEEIMDEYIS
ncbi:NADH dehydrogenase [Oopsacas minuta]|uniref:NADH dehydrogenase [ubiquinone] 1 alpha subcomplex subunit 7 n=1 Tax=Oopsacas minuta TaxID=111878 RepID=A0AAV7K391_9METZ|nr:NADH dehydrogenase [Oopsacas minuta]